MAAEQDMDSNHDIGRSIGVLIGTVTALEERVSRNEVTQATSFRDFGIKLEEISSYMAENRGRHTMLASLGASAVAVLSLVIAVWGKAFGHG